MIDTYLKSTDASAFDNIRDFAINVIGPVQGRAESLDAKGEIVKAAGDPAYFYCCVRALFPVPAFGSIELCSVEEGSSVVGVWA